MDDLLVSQVVIEQLLVLVVLRRRGPHPQGLQRGSLSLSLYLPTYLPTYYTYQLEY